MFYIHGPAILLFFELRTYHKITKIQSGKLSRCGHLNMISGPKKWKELQLIMFYDMYDAEQIISFNLICYITHIIYKRSC